MQGGKKESSTRNSRSWGRGRRQKAKKHGFHSLVKTNGSSLAGWWSQLQVSQRSTHSWNWRRYILVWVTDTYHSGPITLIPKIRGVAPVYRNACEFLKFIDALPPGPKFFYTPLKVMGDMMDANGDHRIETLELWHCDPIECIARVVYAFRAGIRWPRPWWWCRSTKRTGTPNETTFNQATIHHRDIPG